jgi:hypothetical protein
MPTDMIVNHLGFCSSTCSDGMNPHFYGCTSKAGIHFASDDRLIVKMMVVGEREA